MFHLLGEVVCNLDAGAYRSALEVAEFKARDPLPMFRQRAEREGWLEAGEYERVEQKIIALVDDAVAFADASPAPEDLCKNIYVQPIDPYKAPS